MSYDGEVDEKDWCQEHACYIWRCSHPHPDSFEERHDAIDAIQNQAPVGWRGAAHSHPLEDKNLCAWCHQEIKTQIFKDTGHCCEDHRKLLEHETGLANPNPRKEVTNNASRSD